MKALLFLLFVITGFSAFGQNKDRWDDSLIGKRIWKVKPLPREGSDIVYTGHEQLPGYSRDHLFKNVLDWYNNNYKSADTRLEVENKDRGTIAGSGLIHYSQRVTPGGPENIFFSFSIQMDSAGYSYRVYDIYSIVAGQKELYSDMYREESHPSPGVRQRWDHKYRYEVLSDMDTFITLAINQLKKQMASP